MRITQAEARYLRDLLDADEGENAPEGTDADDLHARLGTIKNFTSSTVQAAWETCSATTNDTISVARLGDASFRVTDELRSGLRVLITAEDHETGVELYLTNRNGVVLADARFHGPAELAGRTAADAALHMLRRA